MGLPKTLAEVLDGQDSAHALHVVNAKGPISRSSLRSAVRDLAGQLRASGIKPGDVVSIADGNTVSIPPINCHPFHTFLVQC